MIPFIFKNWRLVIACISILSALGGVFYYGHTKYREGHKDATRVCNEQREGTKNAAIKTRLEQDNVIRPDDAAYIERLLGGTL